MVHIIAFSFVVFTFALLGARLWNWRKHYAVAKASGFPVFLTPIHQNDFWWLALDPLVAPLLGRLPSPWVAPWYPLSRLLHIWKLGYEPFLVAGHDTFILSSPKGNMLWTCDSAVVQQAWTQPTKSRVPVEDFGFLDLGWGPNIQTVEGEEWKAHRKIVMSALAPSTNALAWQDTVYQTSVMVDRWIENGSTITVMKKWMSMLALHVVAATFFNKRLHWTDEADTIPEGHVMSFQKAINTVGAKAAFLFMIPRFFLRVLPFEACREASIAHTEWTKYMIEFRDDALSRMDIIRTKNAPNIVERLVLANQDAEYFYKGTTQTFPKPNILSDIWFIMFAGHDTTGNTMTYLLLLLALYPEHQHTLHAQLDAHFSIRSPHSSSYEQDFATLHAGFLGACIKETLRTYNVAQFMVRLTTAPLPTTDSFGRHATIPPATLVVHDKAAQHRNPRLRQDSDPPVSHGRRAELHDSPALDFNPHRWMKGDAHAAVDAAGGFYPFGQGPRVCVGQNFARVETVAMAATVLREYRLELVVDESLVGRCDGDEKRAWEMARDEGLRTLVDGVTFNLSLDLWEKLPVRVVRR